MRWLAATLLGLLGLAYALIIFAAPSAEVHPAPNDRGFGGLALLAEAMRSKGYRVSFDPSARPHLKSTDLAIVPVLGSRAIPSPVLDYVRKGGRTFVINVPSELQGIGATEEIYDVLRRSATVDASVSATSSSPLEGTTVASWRTLGDEAVASLTSEGKGRVAQLSDGALATNRFLGRHDNARVVFSTLESVARSDDRLVFVAGGYGEAEEVGPIEAVGPWAVGALWQSLAVLAAFGAARGIRFGLPSTDTRSRKGSRELLDVVATHYRRGRRTEAPLLAAARERPYDRELQAVAARTKVSEADARRILIESEARPKPRRPFAP